MRENWSYSIALFALKLPPGCAVTEFPGGVTFGNLAAREGYRVEVFLRAGYAYAASPQEAEARYLEFLRGHLPAQDGWICHSVKVEALSEIDEMLDRLVRGEPLGPAVPDHVAEPPDESLLM